FYGGLMSVICGIKRKSLVTMCYKRFSLLIYENLTKNLRKNGDICRRDELFSKEQRHLQKKQNICRRAEISTESLIQHLHRHLTHHKGTPFCRYFPGNNNSN